MFLRAPVCACARVVSLFVYVCMCVSATEKQRKKVIGKEKECEKEGSEDGRDRERKLSVREEKQGI